MSIKPVIFAVLAAAGGAAQAAAEPPRLVLATEPPPPAAMADGGRTADASTEKVREIMARAHIDYTIEVLPWKRAYMSALQRPNGCVFSTTRTPEREHLFKWIGPTDEGVWVLMGRADRNYQLRTLEDARAYRIGTYNGDARDHFLRERGFKVDPAQNDLVNPQKLLMGRIDLWAASLRSSSTFIAQNGWTGQIVPVLTFYRTQVYLACNPAVPDELVRRMAGALDAMVRDGSARRIEQKADGPQRAAE